MLRSVGSPAELARVVEDRQARHDPAGGPAGGRWVTLADLLADDAALLRSAHDGLVATGAPPKAAANHLVAWIGGALGETVAFVLVATGAGVLVDGRARWRLQPGGWADRTDVSACDLVVPAGHPWQGSARVRAEADGQVVAQTVAALVTDLTPYVEACSGLATVSRASLWAQVADGIGWAAAADPGVAGLDQAVPTLDALLDAPGTPWRKRPCLWRAGSACGPVLVARKGGCCLAYLAEAADWCMTCPFRACSDVEARVVTWAESVAAPGRQALAAALAKE